MLKKIKIFIVAVFIMLISSVTIVYADDNIDSVKYNEDGSEITVSFDVKSGEISNFYAFSVKDIGLYDISLECDESEQLKKCNIYRADNTKDIFITLENFGVFYENIRINNVKNNEVKYAFQVVQKQENSSKSYHLTFRLKKHSEDKIPTLGENDIKVTCPKYGCSFVKFVPTKDSSYAIRLPEYLNEINSRKVYDEFGQVSVEAYEKINDTIKRITFNDSYDEAKYFFGNHNAIDIPNLQAGHEYYFNIVKSGTCEGDVSYYDVSIKPIKVERVSIDFGETSFTSFNSIVGDVMKGQSPIVNIKYKDEEETIFSLKGVDTDDEKSMLEYEKNFYSIGYFMGSLKILLEKLSEVDKQKNICFVYLDCESMCSISSISGYEYASKYGSKLNIGANFKPDLIGRVFATGINEAYKMINVSKDGVYELYTVKDNKAKECVIHDSKDNEVQHIKNEGYVLKKGQSYALYVNHRSGTDLVFTNSKTHKHTKQITKKAVAASYTHTGKTSEIKCKVCGEIIQKSKVIAKKILPKPVIIKAKLVGNKANVTWKVKKGKYTYEVQYSTYKNMKKGCKLQKVTANRSNVIVSKLNNKKKYYVRIRATIIENKKKIVGKWSNLRVISK